jgi:hypothetical protein
VTDKPAAEEIYARVAALGVPWRFVCEEDIATTQAGTLLIPAETGITPDAARAIGALPDTVSVIAVGGVPTRDEYGQPLDGAAAGRLAARVAAIGAIDGLEHADPGEPYNAIGTTPYLYWLPDKGHFQAPMTYPVLEARRVRVDGGWLVAIINHATEGEPVVAGLPWGDAFAGMQVTELTGAGGEMAKGAQVSCPPLAVRVFLCTGR